MGSRFTRIMWVLTAIFCVVLVTDVVPWLRGIEPYLPGDLSWEWPYAAPRWPWLIASIIAVVIYVLGATRLVEAHDENDTRFPVKLILWTFVGSTLLTLLVVGIEQRPIFLLFTRSVSLVTGGYAHASAMMGDLGAVLRNWGEFAATYKNIYWINSVTTAPPGIGATYYGITRVLDHMPPVADTLASFLRPLVCQDQYIMQWSNAQIASAWPQMGMPLWISLSVAPLYNVGKMVFNRKIARQAIALWGLTPGLLLFTPRFNVFWAFVSIVMLSLIWRGLLRKRWLPLYLAGFALGVSIFMNLVVVPLGLLAILNILGYGLYKKDRWGDVFRALTVYLIGVGTFWLVYMILAGQTPLQVWQVIRGYHFAVTNRPYWPWIIQHPIDMFLFIGLPMSALMLWRVWILVRERKNPSLADVFVGASFLTLLALDLSGITQGESGRLWLIFAPAWMLLAADVLMRLSQRNRFALVVMQAVVMLSMAAVLRVHFTALTDPVIMPSASTTPQFPINAQYVRGNDKVTLVGVDVDKTQTAINLRLYWRADTFVQNHYQLSLVPVPPNQAPMPSINWDPQKWLYPPACWLPGQTFTDTVSVPVGDQTVGNWLFSLGILNVHTGDSMQVAGQNGTQVGIGPVSLP